MLTPLLLSLTLLFYFGMLHLITRKSQTGNHAFFRAERRSPWWMVAFGMIGSSLSGVSFVSVPGWTATTGMTYLQMCMGFIFGYMAVAFVLLPLYYRMNLTSIYAYLGDRFGPLGRLTGSVTFFIGKFIGASARLYVACLVLHSLLPPSWNLPFGIVCAAVLLAVWGYTHRGGMAAVVRTDVWQTVCLLISLVMLLGIAAWKFPDVCYEVVCQFGTSDKTRIFDFSLSSPTAFWRQFLSGIFMVVVMTGLDQDMMQKNLTCRTLRDAQKNMCVNGLCYLPVNFLLLSLGVIFYEIAAASSISAEGDQLLPAVVASGILGATVVIPFVIGLVAATLSSIDSALTALTTSCCIDLLGTERQSEHQAQSIRKRVHAVITAAFFIGILVFHASCINGSLINTIYRLVSYTYGPLLGLFAFGLFTPLKTRSAAIPAIAFTSPVLCGLLDFLAPRWGYTFGYELLLLNGLFVFIGLWMLRRNEKKTSKKEQETITKQKNRATQGSISKKLFTFTQTFVKQP